MEKISEWALKLLPEYASFLIRFASAPIAAMRPFSGKNAVEPVLFSFVLVSMVVGWVIGYVSFVLILDTAQQARAIEVLALAYGRFKPIAERWYVPLIALPLLLLCLGIVLHTLAYGYHRSLNVRGPEDNDFRLGGSLWDTINAVLGFSALYVPAHVAFGAVSTWSYFQSQPAQELLLFWVDVGTNVVMLFVYLPAALAGTHPNTSFRQAALASSVAVGGLLFVVSMLT